MELKLKKNNGILEKISGKVVLTLERQKKSNARKTENAMVQNAGRYVLEAFTLTAPH